MTRLRRKSARCALLLGICCSVVLINWSGPSPYAYRQGQNSNHAQSAKKSTTPRSVNADTVTVKTPSAEQQTSPPANADHNNEKRSPYLGRLVSAELLPNTVLAVIGIIGIVVAVCTLLSLKKQTTAILASVKLQEINLRQWVTLTNWHYSFEGGEANRLSILFDVTNPTQIPLDLDLVSTKIHGQDSTHGAAHWLTPNNPYTVSAAFNLDEEQFAKFSYTKLIIDLRCDVFYRDAQDTHWNQIFDRVVVLRKSLRDDVYVLESRTRVRDSTPTKAAIETALDQKTDEQNSVR